MISAPVAPPTVRADAETVLVSLRLRDDDTFEVDYGDIAVADTSPSPTRLLGASIAMCLAASLLHCLRKGRFPINGFEASAVVTVERNEKGRLRVQRVNVLLDPGVGAEYAALFDRCSALFEDYCTVTESVRQGIDVRVTVATN